MSHDLDILQGVWSVTSLQLDGENTSGEMIAQAQIRIEGDRFVNTGMGAVYTGTMKLDANVKPRRIELHFDSGPEAGNVNRGIYEVNADRWKLCLDTRGGPAPSKFASEPGSGVALEVLERANAPARPKPMRTTANSAAAASPAAATELEGEWNMVSAVMNGAVMDDATVQWVRRVNEGNVTAVYAGPQTMLKAEFSHNAWSSPATIDYTILAGPNRGKRQLGIYSLRQDLLKICMSAPGAPERPDAFDSVKGDERVYTVWRKARG